jgi:hypothetical protein
MVDVAVSREVKPVLFYASLLLLELQTQYIRSLTFCPDGDDYGDDNNDNDDGYAH